MTHKFTLALCLVASILFTGALRAQENIVWPADVNNNGAVNGIDFLFWAHAFGSKGEQRPGASASWVGQAMGTPWMDTYPDGHNFAYADPDGDGQVAGRDFRLLSQNLFRTSVPAPLPDPWERPDTTDNYEAFLQLQPAGFQLTSEGLFLQLDVNLRGPDSTFSAFHGISFSATFTPGLLTDYRGYDKETSASVIRNADRLQRWLQVDSSDQQMIFTITALDHLNRTVGANGPLSRISMLLPAGFDPATIAGQQIWVDSVLLVDRNFVSHRVATDTLTFAAASSCSFTVNPVCGSNGITYLNGCFAEAAGITVYTQGACWNPGLVAENMNPAADCPTAYEPVCGFNGVTYSNACAAEAAGVVTYFTGTCSADLSCYDPNLILISSGTSLNQATGVISLSCVDGDGPVCGCDGEQYASACLAEAAGVRGYTTGGCDADCIVPADITDTDDCGTATDFVCGCNGETYINPCYAEAAGLQSYTAGPCNGSSGWCDEATVIACGDYLPNESTIGAGNQITSYPGATSVLMQGPDRVYVFEKTTAGDLQVGLEIMTPGLNMDLFLLTGDCGNYTVVGSSTYSNNQTNNEGIVFEDAPNGTYYIIVDQAAAGVGGNYRLELSCGYLDCSDRVPLACGIPYHGTNAGGADDVSTYSCGPRLNVENNGPEIVHSFTTTEAGLVTIDLVGLSADLELFLLSECSRRSCLQYSQNPGTTPEQIVRHLPAGTYYVVVDGYNGAISNYTLNVDCSSSCDLSAEVTGQSGSNCGQSGGSINFWIDGGTPLYTAHYVGPVCRSASSTNGDFTFTHLPPGDYIVTFEDGSGCQLVVPFTISSADGGLDGIMTPSPAGCGEEGRIDVSLTTSGVAPYTIYLSGDLTRTFTTNSVNFVILPLPAGHYSVTVVDAGGCSFSENVTVEASAGNLDVTTWTEPAGCDGSLGEIVVQAPNGALPYFVTVSGPVSGSASVNGYNFRVRSLPAGAYTFTLTDAFGCSYEANLVVNGGNLAVDVSATPANCALPGAARVNISSGAAPYTINYTGPVSGTVNTSEAITVINNLPTGTYNFSIWAADGCDQSETVFVGDNGGNLDFSVTQMLAACDGNNSELQLLINGGTPNYTVTYTGTVTGSVSVGGNGTATLSLPPGSYTFTATDFGNCTATTELTVNGGLSSADQSSFLFGNDCGQLDNIRTIVFSGDAPFQVAVTTDACPEANQTFTSNTGTFDLTDLPNCTYTIAVTDANGCTSSQVVIIEVDPENSFLELTAGDGACGGLGYIDLEVTAGEHPYFINWTGPVNGSVNLVGQVYRVNNLPAGTYHFSLTNGDGCAATQHITLLNDGTLDVISSVVTDDCGVPDQIWNDIEGGVGPYTVTVTRLCDNVVVDVEMSGAGFEIINLIPCDYKIVVVDANGCMTMRTVTIDPYQLFNALVTDGVCGQPGSIELMVMNSNAVGPYTITYSGPVNGSLSDVDGQRTLEGLPAGNYTITITDANGCTETETVTVTDIPSDLELQTALINNDCGQYNQLWNDINGGTGPFSVVVTRLCDGLIDTTFTQPGRGFELTDLDECCYKITVTDATGCMVMTESCVEDPAANLVNVTPVSGPCGEDGRIDLSFIRGTAPYNVVYTGPVSGNNTVNGNVLSINDAPAGVYTIVVTDSNGCTETETTTVVETTSNLVLQAALIYNECGQYNQIWVDIFNGTGPFAIEVIRLCDGTTMTEFVTGEVGFELTDLEPCDYKIIVTDAAGCMVMDVITVFPGAVDLFDLTSLSGECNELGSFNLHITSGRAPFHIVYNGPVSADFTTSDTLLSRHDLPSGAYTLFVTDSLGCSETGQFTIENTTTDLDLVTSLIFNDCGQLNQLWNDINGGIGPFDVEVTRLCDGTVDTTFTTSERQFELFDRMPCTYKIKVTDATGCMDMESIQVQSSSANLFEVTIDNSCDSSGFHLNFIAGTAPYRVVIAGPVTQQFLDVTDELYIPAPPGDYSLRAWSNDGCSEMNFSGITGGQSGELPEVGFTPTNNGLAVSFTNNSGTGDYAWDFDDGSEGSTATNPQHNFAAAGTYNVCLTVTNPCGENTACQEVTVSNSANVQVIIGGDSGATGGTARIPVSIQGTDNIATISGTLALSDPGLATISHLSAGAISPQYNPDNQSFSFVATGTGGVNLAGDINVLFFIHLDLGQTAGSADILLVDSPLALEVSAVRNGNPILLPATYLPGFVDVSANVLGNIQTQAHTTTGDQVESVTFQLSEPDGGYVIDLPENEAGIAGTLAGLNMDRMYYIEPIKTTDYRNGLSSFEIFLAQRYLLGQEVPEITDPLQVVALDMNCSQHFSNLDLLIMQTLLVDDIAEVPGCNSWTFVPDSHVFPADWQESRNVFPAPRRAEIVLQGDTMVMFTGVKTGDLLGDADAARSAGTLPLTVALPELLTAGQEYELVLRLADAAELVSLQGILEVGTDLKIQSVSAPELPGLRLNESLLARGQVRLSWFSETGNARALDAGAVMVKLAVRATRSGRPAAGLIKVAGNRGFAAAAHNGQHQRLLPEVQMQTQEVAAFRFIGAAPNPATDFVELRFAVPGLTPVHLQLFDALGRPVVQREQTFPAGPQRLRLDTRALPAGAYHYQLRAGTEVVSGKVVLRR